LQRLLHRETSFGNERLQRFPFDELHRDEVHAAARSRIVNRDDVGMRERRSRARFLEQTAALSGMSREFRRQDLQGNEPAQLFVIGPVYRAHPAFAGLFANLVVPHALARFERLGCFGNGQESAGARLVEEQRLDFRAYAPVAAAVRLDPCTAAIRIHLQSLLIQRLDLTPAVRIH
jgi:hypothetical protein